MYQTEIECLLLLHKFITFSLLLIIYYINNCGKNYVISYDLNIFPLHLIKVGMCFCVVCVCNSMYIWEAISKTQWYIEIVKN